ncbi:MAG TPA: BTAD domain-containing putative transcriptional regulator, partial [Acidimicrobiales bacterium]
GAVLRLAEDDLRFDPDELTGFARQRGLDPGRFDATGGWPAMAELAASVTGDLTGDYLWEEVLLPLGPDRRRVLAVLSDLGGADDELASAALGTPVDLASTLDGVPLVAQGTGGWRVPHPLWRTVRALGLDDDDRLRARHRAIDHLLAHHRYDEAVTLARDPALAGEVPRILRAACIGPMRPPTRRLERWLAELPGEARGSAGAALATGLRAAVATPGEATEPLQTAIALCREAGDTEGELSAIAVLGRVAWWRSDAGLLAQVFPRVLELEAEGHPLARAIAGIGRAIVADLEGDDDAVLANLDAIPPGALDPAWEVLADWLRATILVGRGDAAAAAAVLAGIPDTPDPAFRMTVEGARLAVAWAEGHIDQVMAELAPLVDRIRTAGVLQNLQVATAQAAFAYASAGEVETARALLSEARRTEHEAGTGPTTRMAMAVAAVAMAEGDEAAAAEALAAAAERQGIAGLDRRVWRHGLALGYVLVPELRPQWDAAPLRGYLADARGLAAAVVALREATTSGSRAEDARRVLADLDLADPALVRSALHHRLAVELALGLESAGRPEAGPLLESLGPPGREALRAVAARTGRHARPARALLAAVPAPPLHATEIAVLGPLAIVRDGEPVADGDLRRERVRALIAYLVGHRSTTRSAIMAALWPDLDEKPAANNLRVTLTYMLRLLEPWRTARESSYYVRVDGQSVSLVTGELLQVDLDRFDDHVDRALRADADGVPSVALDHDLAAVELYRGDLHEGVAEAEWFALERDRARGRFVAAATRAGELLVGRGDADEAERLARRAVAADPWAEAAYGVLVSVALARGDRLGARRALDRLLSVLGDLGVDPSEETQQLRRRVRARP